MKKLIAVTIVALMMFAVGASSFALVVDTPAGYKNPPVFISGISVSDAWMSGLTVQNWQGSLTNQAYAEGSYIWFIAKISVSAYGDTDAAHMWDGVGDDEAKLTLTGKDGCLNFASANMATLAKINGMNVVARQISSTNTNVVDATEGRAIFKFNSQTPFSMDSNGTLSFDDNTLNDLTLDAVYDSDTFIGNDASVPAYFSDLNNTNPTTSNGNISISAGTAWYYGGGGAGNYQLSKSTNQKDYYLHFMAITKSATEGVCSGTMTVNGDSEFERDTQGMYVNYNGVATGTSAQVGSVSSYTQSNWWGVSNVGQYNVGTNDTDLEPGDRSKLYLLYNTVNGKTYSIGKINGKSTQPAKNNFMYGPYADKGSIYILMNQQADDFVIGFSVADGKFQGLVTWNDDRYDANVTAPQGITYSNGVTVTLGKAGDFDYINNPHTWEAAYYIPLMSNDYSNNLVSLSSAYKNMTVGTSELQAIFDFFGFAYVNPKAPTDADFLSRTGLVTTAEAKYNVANAVVTTPDTSVVIPKTGDAATSTGLILVASAILAAAAVGFVLSKRAYN